MDQVLTRYNDSSSESSTPGSLACLTGSTLESSERRQLTPLVSLDTPVTVEVVILADPVSRCFCQILIHRLVHFCEHRMVMRFVSWAMKRFANSPRLTLQQTS